ncbi:MAG: hypothetical protein WKG32_21280 [Gemmatimonadaceae bacterium]
MTTPTTTRRDFLDRLTVGAAVLGGLPLALGATARALDAASPATPAPEWDTSWVKRVTGKHKAVFDVPEVESGYGVWRASIWVKQYGDVFGTPARDMSPVVVLRHNGIALAMQQAFWDKYGIGKLKDVKHPVTLEPTDRNPALLSSARKEQPEQFDAMALDKYLARGGIALACNLALQDCVELIQKQEGVSPEEARKRAIAMLVPGVILQPSGVFAALLAQEAGCSYLRAS